MLGSTGRPVVGAFTGKRGSKIVDVDMLAGCDCCRGATDRQAIAPHCIAFAMILQREFVPFRDIRAKCDRPPCDQHFLTLPQDAQSHGDAIGHMDLKRIGHGGKLAGQA